MVIRDLDAANSPIQGNHRLGRAHRGKTANYIPLVSMSLDTNLAGPIMSVLNIVPIRFSLSLRLRLLLDFTSMTLSGHR